MIKNKKSMCETICTLLDKHDKSKKLSANFRKRCDENLEEQFKQIVEEVKKNSDQVQKIKDRRKSMGMKPLN